MKKLTIIIGMVLVISSLIVPMIAEETEAAAPEQPTTRAAHTPMRVNDDAEMAAISSAGDGTADSPWLVTGFEINAGANTTGLYIGNVTEHFVIDDCDIYNVDGVVDWTGWFDNGAGIHIQNCDNGNITNCNINSTGGYGIFISNTSLFINVTDNVLWNCSYRGISLHAANHCIFDGNIIYGNDTTNFGLVFDNISDSHTVTNNHIYSVMWAGIAFNDSWHINITANIITGNATYGGDLAVSPAYGIATYNSAYINMDGNYILNCSVGLLLTGSHTQDTWDGTIDGNYLDGVTNGILTGYASNLSVTSNYVNNTITIFNASVTDGIACGLNTNNTTISSNYITSFQTGINVTANCSNITIFVNHMITNVYGAWGDNNNSMVSWDNGYSGNWWDDWTVPDANYDGIVDIPYYIYGLGANHDDYPRCTVTVPVDDPEGNSGTTSGGGSNDDDDDDDTPPVDTTPDADDGGICGITLMFGAMIIGGGGFGIYDTVKKHKRGKGPGGQ